MGTNARSEQKTEAKSNPVRAWYLKLEYLFFEDKTIKLLRKKCKDSGVLVYLKMMSKALPHDSILTHEEPDCSLAEEIGFEINEDDVECIECVIDFLKNRDELIDVSEDGTEKYMMPRAQEMSGRITESGVRMARKRERDRQSVTSASLCDESMTNIKVKEKKSKSKTKEEKSYSDSSSSFGFTLLKGELSPDGAAAESRATGTSPFAWDDVVEANKRNGLGLSDDQLKDFWEWMTKSGWTIREQPVVKLDNALKGYANKHKPKEDKKPRDARAETALKFYRIFAQYVPREMFEKYGCPILSKPDAHGERKELDEDHLWELAKTYIPAEALRTKALKDWFASWTGGDEDLELDALPQQKGCQMLRDMVASRKWILDGEPDPGEEYQSILRCYDEK